MAPDSGAGNGFDAGSDDVVRLVVLGGDHGHPSSGQLGHWLDSLTLVQRNSLTARLIGQLDPDLTESGRYVQYGQLLVDAYRDAAFEHRDDWRGFGAAYRHCDDHRADLDADERSAAADSAARARAVRYRGGCFGAVGVLRRRVANRVSSAWAFALMDAGVLR